MYQRVTLAAALLLGSALLLLLALFSAARVVGLRTVLRRLPKSCLLRYGATARQARSAGTPLGRTVNARRVGLLYALRRRASNAPQLFM